jgi:hypothetical protein
MGSNRGVDQKLDQYAREWMDKEGSTVNTMHFTESQIASFPALASTVNAG